MAETKGFNLEILIRGAEEENKIARLSCPIQGGATIQALLNANSMNPNTSSLVVLCLYSAYMEVQRDEKVFEFPIVVQIAENKVMKVAEVNLASTVQAPLTSTMVVQYRNYLASRHRWLLDLVSAFQVKATRPRNITNYFKGANLEVDGESLMRHVQFFASAMPPLIRSETVQRMIVKDKWLSYHTTYASTPQLCHKAIAAINTYFDRGIPGLTSGKEVEAVRLAVARPWDAELANAIPAEIVCLTYWFLRSVRQLPDNWYQGERLRDHLPPSVVGKLTNLFEGMVRLSSNKASFEEAQDRDALLTAFTR